MTRMTLMEDGGCSSAVEILNLVAAGNSKAVATLLQSQNVPVDALNVPDKNGRTCLSYAAASGDVSMIDLLLATDIPDANLADTEGNTPLIYAVSLGHSTVTGKLLKYDNTDIDQVNKNGFTALIKAAIHDNRSCVELLLQAEANPELTDFTRHINALQWAKLCGSQTCIRALKKSKTPSKKLTCNVRSLDKKLTKSASDLTNLKTNNNISPLKRIRGFIHNKQSTKEHLAIDSIVMCVSTPAIPILLANATPTPLRIPPLPKSFPDKKSTMVAVKTRLTNNNILPKIEITSDTGENIIPNKQCYTLPAIKHK